MQVQAAQWEADRDLRCVFLSCYALMTQNMLHALAAGRFNDRRWVDRLLHRFAAYYFDALELYDAHSAATPAVWQQAHDAACGREASSPQLLLAGVNAHINYDLVLTLHDLLAPEWPGLTEAQRRQRYADHCLVNTVIAETIDAVQDDVIERHDPWLDLVDKGLGRLDEWLTARLIARWRHTVWQQAVRLVMIEEAAACDTFCARVEADALQRGARILGRLS